MRSVTRRLIAVLFFLPCSWLNAEIFPAGPLSNDVIPTAYQLQLKINPKQDHFSGVARIDLEIQKPLRFFWMHGNHLTISSVVLQTQAGKSLTASYEQVSVDGVVKITLPQEVAVQKAAIVLRYEAKLTNALSGLYKVTVDKIPYVFTQFEPIAARECFPGFDEPRFKTPFQVSLIVPSKNIAIANTPIFSEKIIAAGQKLVTFLPTKPLPTYLVAFAVGPFDVIESKAIVANTLRKNAIPFRAIAVKGMGPKLKYALQHTPHLLQLLEDYFQIPYPYEKLDIIAVPDFAAGAMENAGAITFRDSLLIIDDKTAPVSQKRSFAYVMAHELAHQWFGNLVTMPWWNDLWLNEAFATWIEYRIVEKFNPDYMAELALQESIHNGMHEDDLMSARQIMQPIVSYHDIYSAFDPITYEKGAGVLSMFERYLGEDVFQKSIQYHLNRFAFGTATAADFIDSLSTISKKDLHGPFLSFIEQPGIPRIKADYNCSLAQVSLELNQSRYFPIGSLGDSKKYWQVPFCYKYEISGQIKDDCLLLKDETTYWDFDSQCPNWILMNTNAAGYYRWMLPTDKIEALTQNHLNTLTVREQFDLINNIKAGFSSGDLKAQTVFKLLPYFLSIKNRFVASAPIGTLQWINEYAVPLKLSESFQKYVSSLYDPILQELPLKSTATLNTEETNLFQIELYDLLANLAKDQKIRAMLKKNGALYVHDLTKKRPNKNTELALVSVAVWAEETPGSSHILKKLLLQTNDPMQRKIILNGLSQGTTIPNAGIIYQLLLGEDLRRNEVIPLLSSFMSNDHQKRKAGWNWFKENYDALSKALPEKKAAGFPYLASGFCSAQKEEEVRNFFAKKVENLPGGPGNLKETLERISLCHSLVEAQKKSVEAFLIEHKN